MFPKTLLIGYISISLILYVRIFYFINMERKFILNFDITGIIAIRIICGFIGPVLNELVLGY